MSEAVGQIIRDFQGLAPAPIYGLSPVTWVLLVACLGAVVLSAWAMRTRR